MILVVYFDILSIFAALPRTAPFSQMIESNTSYRNYRISGKQPGGEDRLPLGSALLATFGLSLLAWALFLVPLVAILHD